MLYAALLVQSRLCRTDRVEVLKTLQYNDTMDVFEREPYSVLIRSTKEGYMNTHTHNCV